MATASFRFARHPRWVAGPVPTAVFAMGLLGRSAAIIAPSQGSQPAEAPAVLDEPVTYRRYVMPNPTTNAGPQTVRYHAYFAALADQS